MNFFLPNRLPRGGMGYGGGMGGFGGRPAPMAPATQMPLSQFGMNQYLPQMPMTARPMSGLQQMGSGADGMQPLASLGGGGPQHMGMPSYKYGTSYVPKTGPAMLHAGEMVIPAPKAKKIRKVPLSSLMRLK